MKGYRKLALGLAFLVATTFLGYVNMTRPNPDLLGLSTVIGAQAAGVLAIVYGNVKEHQAQNGKNDK
jgi:hypothetical protein